MCAVALDGFFESEVEGVADERMPDAHFVQPGNLLVEVGEVLQVQVVAGVQPQSCVAGSLRSADEGCDGGGAVG